MSEGPARDSNPVKEPPDPEVAARIRSMLLGLSADLVAHVSRSTGASPETHPEPSGPPP